MNTGSGNQALASQQDDEIDLSQIVHMLRSNIWIILLVTFVTFALGALYSSIKIPQYQSDVLLQIEDGRRGGAGNAGNLSNMFDMGGSSENAAAVQSALIKSRFILGPVIHENGLDIITRPDQSFFKRKFFPSHNSVQVTEFDSPTNTIDQRFRLSYDKPNHFILSTLDGAEILQGETGKLVSNKDKSFQLKITAVDAPVGAQFILQRTSDYEIIQMLLHKMQIMDLGGKLNTGVLQVSLSGPDPVKVMHILDSIARATTSKNIEKKSMEASKTLEFLYEQLPLAKQTLEAAETKLNRYRASSGKIDIKIQSQSLLTKLADLDKQQEALRIDKINNLERYTPEHPFMLALEKQIKGVESTKKEMERQLKTLPASDQIAVNLMRDVEVKNSLYLILLNKIQELQVIKEGTISDVHVLSYAKLPNAPLPSKRGLIYLGSILLGLLISALIIFARKNFSPRIDDPHWSERKFNIVNLAIIPYCKEQAVNMSRFNKESGEEGLPLLAHNEPRNLSVESLRSLRTSLQVTLSFATNNIIAILGISPGVGKTFVSSNLAYLLASGGKRVLLIDADLRRGVLNNSFNLSNKPGLSELIAGTVSAEDAITEECGHANLSVLPCGAYPSNPSELLMSDRFKHLVQLFSKEYDIVLIDTAPVLLVTDGVLVGSMAGTNFLVMGANTHQPTEIEMTIKRLTSAGVKLHGTIFNFSRPGSTGQGYYRYYRYNPYYGTYGTYGTYGAYDEKADEKGKQKAIEKA